jgi:hypothetical protein
MEEFSTVANVFIAVVTALGGSATIFRLINIGLERKRLGAETEDTVVKTSAKREDLSDQVFDRAMAFVDEISHSNSTLRDLLNICDEERERYSDLLIRAEREAHVRQAELKRALDEKSEQIQELERIVQQRERG